MRHLDDSRRRTRAARLALTGLAAAALCASGCATTAGRVTGLQTAQAGLCATESAVKACEALGELRSDNAYYQGYLRIVVSPTPDRVDFTAVPDADFSQQLDARLNALRRLHTAYVLFSQLCEGKTAKDASRTYAAMAETLKGLSHDEAASLETRAAVAQMPGEWTALWQARRIARAERILGRMAAETAALWEHDRAAWSDAIDAVYLRHYAAGLLSLSLENFDERELAKAVDAPYRPPVKAGLYKLGLYRDALQKAQRLKSKLGEASDAFRQLTLMQGLAEGDAAAPARTRAAAPRTTPHLQEGPP